MMKEMNWWRRAKASLHATACDQHRTHAIITHATIAHATITEFLDRCEMSQLATDLLENPGAGFW
jgi:hypothetical protein